MLRRWRGAKAGRVLLTVGGTRKAPSGKMESCATEGIGGEGEGRDEWRHASGARESARFLTENTADVSSTITVAKPTCR